ncbi:GntR family transcriptional regulator [Candidatus Epulonipiscium fishelsonii]|uniref:GntR family transcriptional regulator n=1 Tax=Candidatus Epulonipiscium fishelsonii TaxID=77094 RepID=A0ACC8XCS8_9FIRM|nr:GntR family transcriptional regulator [Epulopiscium sp. SCG-B11WGA-EpuloA1]
MEALRRPTLTEQIIEELSAKIISGELKAGEKLPTERELAEIFQVTRNRIREALRALAVVGMIVIKPSGGTFVASGEVKIPDKTITWMYYTELNNVEEIYAARKLIETAIYLECFDRANKNIIEHMKALLTVIIESISETESTFLSNLNALDLYVGQNCGNGIYFKLMQTMILLRTEPSLKILISERARKSAIFHRQKIVEAFEASNRPSLEHRLEEFFEDSLNGLYATSNEA